MTLTSMVGGKHQLFLDDEIIEFKPITLEIEVAFEQKLFGKTKQSLQLMRDLVSADEYIKLLRATSDAYALGEYKLLGKNGLGSVQTLDGLIILLSLVTGLPDAKAKSLIKNYGAEIGNTLSSVLHESLGVGSE